MMRREREVIPRHNVRVVVHHRPQVDIVNEALNGDDASACISRRTRPDHAAAVVPAEMRRHSHPNHYNPTNHMTFSFRISRRFGLLLTLFVLLREATRYEHFD